jgi:hypothetical protein
MNERLSYFYLAAALLILPSCGGALVANRPDPIPAGSAAELDGLEADIEREQANLTSLDPAACPDRCRSVQAICDASGRICELVAELGDDALTVRCTRANHACDEARSDGSACSCDATE